ncbi:MAG: chemotaxis response regulator protein-glutamate methylesterase [Moraxellaceae bacterium]|nr:MAG: chemotaxis response regulator protein-glutamate methylesterase [Moraxellaceae bacterium]
MTVKVLVVDDSKFYRHRLCEILNLEDRIEVVGTAGSGEQAIEKTLELSPDVITMDYEMPGMDGITAIREIMKLRPTPVLMFSSLSYEGSRVSNDAINAGAVGAIAKNFDKMSSRDAASNQELTRTIMRAANHSNLKRDHKVGAFTDQVGDQKTNNSPRHDVPDSTAIKKATTRETKSDNNDLDVSKFDLILMASSTGGPVALKRILERVNANFSVPIIVIQHMPMSFTEAFSKRLDQICDVSVKEACDGDSIKKGSVLVAPGGHQLVMAGHHSKTVRVIEEGNRSSYCPSVDVCFNSVAEMFRGKVLAIILTGMGSDGLKGAQSLKKMGATIWAQDEDSCVVYGMPMAVTRANLVDRVLSLADISERMAGH